MPDEPPLTEFEQLAADAYDARQRFAMLGRFNISSLDPIKQRNFAIDYEKARRDWFVAEARLVQEIHKQAARGERE